MREGQRIHGHEADENREVNVIMAHATTFYTHRSLERLLEVTRALAGAMIGLLTAFFSGIRKKSGWWRSGSFIRGARERRTLLMRPRSCAVTEHRCIPDVPTGLARHLGGVSVRRICSMKLGPCDVKAIVECATARV